ncbi:MAG: DNA methylase [Bacteroidia bacterium]|nr:DNA methylase [Bacteroidia bacterium]
MTEKILCLGKEFNSEEERREYFRNELRTKLAELKKIEGFPIGEDEDIVNLSDPPYYTACPNPWLNDFIAEWEKEKERIKERKENFHVDEPYASDVSEGKNNPIYNAHSYHTKVPHPVIMRYILHYTQPGDIILDGFAGTGMTGVAAQLCGNPDIETKFRIEKEFKNDGLNLLWGTRKIVCLDLSPIASFVAYNYNSPIDVCEFEKQSKDITNQVEKEWGWLFETKDKNNNIGKINFTIWSDVFICPNCGSEIIFYNVAVDHAAKEVKSEFNCSNCNAIHTKKSVSKAIVTVYDKMLNKIIQQSKIVPVLINYTWKGKRYEKVPDENDDILIKKVEESNYKIWYPSDRMPEGDESRRNDDIGFTHVHHFHLKSNNIGLASYWAKLPSNRIGNGLKLVASAANPNFSKMRRFRPDGKGGGPLAGTLYISSITTPQNCITSIIRNSDFVKKAFNIISTNDINNSAISTNSCTTINQEDNTVDYIFTDPPFGANIMYSELNFLWESWLKVKTNNITETIENKTQGKSLLEYQNLMTKCFKEYHRVLKPGKWMTVEFSNTSAAVWNGIQTSLQRAGFVIANVAGLDKKQGSFKAVTTPTAVKQDLVISCYKSSSEFENKFKTIQGEIAIWDFVLEHLNHLPTHIRKDNSTTAIIERSSKIIFDRLITFYLMRGLSIPIDARDFVEGLKQRFIERDKMYFTLEQATEYDEKKAKSPNFVQLAIIVTNESDAIEWLKDRLRKQSQKYQDIMPEFRIATQSLRKGDKLPELQNILNESFIQEVDGKWRTPNPNEAKDREALRTKVLLKEFAAYVTAINQTKAKKLKEVRVESLRAGFKNCWEQKDFKSIVTLGDMIPQNILMEDEQLLMYYDIAKDRI